LHGRNITTDSFPELPDEGLVGTFERNYALGREDVSLLTSDHPMVTGAVDLLLGSEQGNCTFGIWPDLNDKTILLEAIFILETLAPAHLSADRFLPPTPIRILVNHKKEPAVLDLPPLNKGLPHKLLDNPKIGRKIIPSMFTSAEEFAEQQSQSLIRDANEVMTTQLEREIDRLRNLRKINDHVRPEEIEIAEDQMENLKKAINKARIRLDAVRLIWKGDPEAIKG
ncbi:MAG TPA: RNA polymerase-binding ATPase, partial [Verrucomicrobiales bacterium]|nr:RNA polymerase-binding ATPase [Verrucomicrobiales bacterium]